MGKENRDGAGLQFNWRLWKRNYWQRISLPGFFSYCEVSEKNITANITLKILSMHFIVVEYPISLLLHHSLTLWTCASSWTTFVFCKYIFYMDSISSRKGRFYIKATKFIPHQRIKPSSEVLFKKKNPEIFCILQLSRKITEIEVSLLVLSKLISIHEKAPG